MSTSNSEPLTTDEINTTEVVAKPPPGLPIVTFIDCGPWIIKVEFHGGPHQFATLTICGVALPGAMVNLTESQTERLIEALSQ